MRLAARALFVALTSLVLCAAVSAQTPRPENDPRNQAPTVGTGGSPGGPTGLFTIFDGDTLRRGEFTFSIAYSNYDRDPGDVDLTVVPLSFNLGLTDHLELFYWTEGLRGVKVNNPKNLSGFYLPNSQLFFGNGLLGSPPAIIIAPIRVSGTTGISGMVFRPAFCPACIAAVPSIGPLGARTSFFVGGQPFVQFPFAGGIGPNFGLTGNAIAPPFTSQLGGSVGDNNNWGAAASFPGYGSPVGSILPGIVLTTRVIPANLTFNNIIVPDLFTVAPTYIADAPFINRLYGESTWGTHVVGAKVRLTGPNNPLGVGFIPFYRFYLDKADEFSGFNELQRGASPGGSVGDIGLIGFVAGRLSRSANLSANLGFIWNSNPKSSAFGGGTDALLDRPDEVVAGVGFDFPLTRRFQPIVELKSTHYVGGRTPNAFQNNPVEVLAGARIYPRRWIGFGGWYRLHLNPQGDRLFGSEPNLPVGFRPSENPHGFGGQFWIGHRNARGLPPPPNQAPTVTVSASTATINRPCPDGESVDSCVPSTSSEVILTANAIDPDNDTLLYTWSVTGGKLSREGREVTWDLTGVNPGTYTASVEVNDGNQHIVPASTTVTVAVCACKPPPCPNIAVSCPSDVEEGQPITFTASVTEGPASLTPTYNWSVSAGTISSGQGTSSITVDTTGTAGQTVTATVDVGGIAPECTTKTASCSTAVKPKPEITPRKFDEYGDIRFNDEKARLDNYAIQLQSEPASTATIIGYGTCEGQGQQRADRAKNYLVNTRGIEASRITTVDGGCRSTLLVQLWIVPTGATQPAVDTTDAVSPCPACRTRRRGRRGRGDDE